MNKSFAALLLCLLCLLLPGQVEARLLLGMVIGTAGATDAVTFDQAHALAQALGAHLQEEVVVQQLTSAVTLMDWLDRLGTLDMALLSVPEMAAHQDRFLPVGEAGAPGRMGLVLRSGLADDLPGRIAEVVREPGYAIWQVIGNQDLAAEQAGLPEPAPEPAREVVETPFGEQRAAAQGAETGAMPAAVTSVSIDTPAAPVSLGADGPDAAATAPVAPAGPQQDGSAQDAVEEVVLPAEAVVEAGPSSAKPAVAEEPVAGIPDDEFLALLGEDTVVDMFAQPDIPQEFRPPGVPVVRPGRGGERMTPVEAERLVATMPEPIKRVAPARPPKLLPEPEPEPGVIYVMPFVSIMVPRQVNARVFDQFVDTMNSAGQPLGLQFVILKEGPQRVTPEWLAERKYVSGEIYAYVEDFGSSVTELRTRVRLNYHLPKQEVPAFGFESPFRIFFDRDRSSIDAERNRLAGDIASTLTDQLLKALRE